jgi:hypothetical protein
MPRRRRRTGSGPRLRAAGRYQWHPGKRAIGIRPVSQRRDGMTCSGEHVIVLAADAGQGSERRLLKDDGQTQAIVSASIRSSAASSSSRLTPPRPAAFSAKCAASAARSSRSARSSMLMSATTGLPCSLMVTGRWVCRAWATSSPCGARKYDSGGDLQPQPVGRLVADPTGLSAQYRVFVPEHQQFGVLGRITPGMRHQTA